MSRALSKINNLIKLLCILATLAMAGISVVIYHADPVSLAIFLGFFIFYLQIPGLMLLKLLGVEPGHISSRLLLSALTGWALVIGEYAVTEFIHTDIVLYVCGPILSVLYILAVLKKNRDYRLLNTGSHGQCVCAPAGSFRNFSFTGLSTALCVFMVLALLYVMLETQFIYLAPSAGGAVAASIDKVYQMGLVDSLADGYPIVNPWVAGRVVHYHIFAQMMYAVPVRLFGLTSDFIIMSCGPYIVVYMLGLAFYSLFRHFCLRSDRAGCYTLSVLLSFMFIAKSMTISYGYRIMFVNDNYGGYAIAGAIGFVIALDLLMKREPALSIGSLGCLLLTIATLILTTGLKAPIGLVMTGAIIGTWLVGIILRKVKVVTIIPVGIMSAAFFAIYKLLLTSGSGSSGSSGVGGESIFGFAKLTGLCFWKAPLIETLTGMGIPSIVRLAVIMALYMLCFFTAFLLPLGIGYLRELILIIRGKKDYRFALVVTYAATLIGLVMSLILRYSGHSQIYFGIVAMAFAPLIAFTFFEDVLAKGSDSALWMKIIARITAVVFFVILVATSACFGGAIKGNIPKAVKHARVDATYSMYTSMTQGEYEAMMWIKENTEEDALLATQMYRSVSSDSYRSDNRWMNTHFLYASYSERNFFLEGSGFSLGDAEYKEREEYIEANEELYDVDNKDRAIDAANIDVDYVVVTKKLERAGDVEPVGDLSYSGYKLVFSNDDIDIYEVK